jgi:hypothetical protein
MPRSRLGGLLLGGLLLGTCAHAQMPTTGLFDLAQAFPNATMSRTHYLHGTGGHRWDLRPMLADGQYNVFYGHAPDGSVTKDIYVVALDVIALSHNVYVDAATGQIGIINYLQPYPSFRRWIDLDALPLHTTTVSHATVVQGGTVVNRGPMVTPVTVTWEEDGLLKCQWGDASDHETLYVGAVPIAGTTATALGVRRYHTTLQGGIDTWFVWIPREHPD